MPTHSIELEVHKQPGRPKQQVTIRQGEAGTQTVHADILNDGTPYTSSCQGVALEIQYSNGKWGRATATKGAGYVECVLPKQATSVPGRCGLAYFSFFNGDTVIETTEGFDLTILPAVSPSKEDEQPVWDGTIASISNRWDSLNKTAENAEATRVEAERSRDSAERGRESAEEARQAKELERERAEAARVANESAREQAEAARTENEKVRSNEHEKCKAALSDASQALSDASQAKADMAESLEASKKLMQDLESAIERGPVEYTAGKGISITGTTISAEVTNETIDSLGTDIGNSMINLETSVNKTNLELAKIKRRILVPDCIVSSEQSFVKLNFNSDGVDRIITPGVTKEDGYYKVPCILSVDNNGTRWVRFDSPATIRYKDSVDTNSAVTVCMFDQSLPVPSLFVPFTAINVMPDSTGDQLGGIFFTSDVFGERDPSGIIGAYFKGPDGRDGHANVISINWVGYHEVANG